MKKFKGGGGSSAPTEQTVYSTDLPEYVEPYFKRLLQRGEAESLQGYTPYGGQRLSYFSPDELTSQAMTRGFATSGTPQQFTDASSRYGGTQGYAPQYQAGQFDPGYAARTRDSGYQAGQVGPSYAPMGYEANLQRFMSPYQQNVIDVEKREAMRQSDIMGKGIGDAATAQGGLGGYREAIQQAERERNLGQQLGDIQTRGSQAAFQSAQQQLAAERAAGLGAAQFGLQQYGVGQQAQQTQEQLMQSAMQAGEQARIDAAKLGLTAQQQEEAARQQQEKFGQSAYDMSNRYNLAAAQGLMGAGQTINQDAVSRIAALQGIGSQQRALSQASMDMGYEDFMRQRDYAQNRLGMFSNILRGVPATPQQTVSQFQQQPGLFQQAMGAGLTGLGLYRGFGGGG